MSILRLDVYQWQYLENHPVTNESGPNLERHDGHQQFITQFSSLPKVRKHFIFRNITCYISADSSGYSGQKHR